MISTIQAQSLARLKLSDYTLKPLLFSATLNRLTSMEMPSI